MAMVCSEASHIRPFFPTAPLSLSFLSAAPCCRSFFFFAFWSNHSFNNRTRQEKKKKQKKKKIFVFSLTAGSKEKEKPNRSSNEYEQVFSLKSPSIAPLCMYHSCQMSFDGIRFSLRDALCLVAATPIDYHEHLRLFIAGRATLSNIRLTQRRRHFVFGLVTLCHCFIDGLHSAHLQWSFITQSSTLHRLLVSTRSTSRTRRSALLYLYATCSLLSWFPPARRCSPPGCCFLHRATGYLWC